MKSNIRTRSAQGLGLKFSTSEIVTSAEPHVYTERPKRKVKKVTESSYHTKRRRRKYTVIRLM